MVEDGIAGVIHQAEPVAGEDWHHRGNQDFERTFHVQIAGREPGRVRRICWIRMRDLHQVCRTRVTGGYARFNEAHDSVARSEHRSAATYVVVGYPLSVASEVDGEGLVASVRWSRIVVVTTRAEATVIARETERDKAAAEKARAYDDGLFRHVAP